MTESQVDREAMDLLRRWEGLSIKVYKDVAGKSTIGYGHLMSRMETIKSVVRFPVSQLDVPINRFNMQRADQLLAEDASTYASVVDRVVAVPLTKYQRSALICFTFNVGGGALIRSTLLKKINQGNYAEAPREMRRWCYAGGRVIPGLLNRRNAEIELWLKKET